jgi:hypothetical protein
MRPVSLKVKKQLLKLPQVCARKGDGYCDGRITWEHAFIYQGRQIDEVWAIIFLCWRHHLGDGLDKEKNEWLAIQKATLLDFIKYPKKNWLQLKNYLNKKYGSHN